MKKLGLLTVVALLLLCAGCRDYFIKSDRRVIAECYGNKLYADELVGVVPEGSSKIDSISRVGTYIELWIHRQLLLHQAENSLTPQQLDFSKELQEYRNSLVVYAYETEIIEQRLDSVVSEEEIATYYEENKGNFELKSNMVRVAYVILDNDNKHIKDFHQIMSDPDTLMVSKLNILASHYAVSSYLNVENWVRLDDLLATVPMEIYNAESFLKKNQFVTFEKDNMVFMVRFEDYRLAESLSPIEIESNHIKNIILQKRKMDLLSRMSDELYQNAVENKVFEIY